MSQRKLLPIMKKKTFIFKKKKASKKIDVVVAMMLENWSSKDMPT